MPGSIATDHIVGIDELVRSFQSSASERRFNGEWGQSKNGNKIGHTRIGRVCRVVRELPPIKRESIAQDEVETQTAILDKAISASLEQIEEIKVEAKQPDQPIEVVGILPDMMEAHELLTTSWARKIRNKIIANNMNAAEATLAVRDEEIGRVDGTKFAYTIPDLESVADRIVRKIKFEEGEECGRSTLADAPHGCILIADELCPSDGVYLQSKHVRGIICRKGSPNGHVATIAKELGIPCLFTAQELGVIHDDMPVIVDSQSGVAILNPSEATIRSYAYAVDLEKRKAEKREEYKGRKIKTKDGIPANVYANIAYTASADRAKKNSADGIGLYRTELMLNMAAKEPSIDFQRHAYRYIMNTVNGNAVTIRLVDIEGDKAEDNWLADADRWVVIENQVEAILLASSDTNVAAHILLPVVRNESELIRLRRMVEQKAQQLESPGPHKPKYKIGMMIEIIAAALEFEHFEKHADFFSFGTNDLNAWLNGQIRNNPKYSDFDDPLRPSSLELIKRCVDIADAAKKHISICGGIASHPTMIPVLLGAGLRKFSAGVEEVLDIKEAIENINAGEAEELVAKIITERDPAKRQEILHSFNQERGIGQYLYKPKVESAAKSAPEASAG